MGVRIPLPRYDQLPEDGVLFHWRYPGDSSELILQVPDEAQEDSESYIVRRRDDTVHKAWLEGLRNSRNLLAMLDYAQHVAYFPSEGYFEEVADLDEVSPVAQNFAKARAEASFERNGDRLRNTFRRRRRVPPMSKLRRTLQGQHRSRGRIRR